jgi:hypothetical protein
VVCLSSIDVIGIFSSRIFVICLGYMAAALDIFIGDFHVIPQIHGCGAGYSHRGFSWYSSVPANVSWNWSALLVEKEGVCRRWGSA